MFRTKHTLMHQIVQKFLVFTKLSISDILFHIFNKLRDVKKIIIIGPQ